MANSRRESHHRHGITDPQGLQQTSATKSARSDQRAVQHNGLSNRGGHRQAERKSMRRLTPENTGEPVAVPTDAKGRRIPLVRIPVFLYFALSLSLKITLIRHGFPLTDSETRASTWYAARPPLHEIQ